MAAKKVGVLVTGTINSHFFVVGQTVTFLLPEFHLQQTGMKLGQKTLIGVLY